jgi:hypothetical protein
MGCSWREALLPVGDLFVVRRERDVARASKICAPRPRGAGVFTTEARRRNEKPTIIVPVLRASVVKLFAGWPKDLAS